MKLRFRPIPRLTLANFAIAVFFAPFALGQAHRGTLVNEETMRVSPSAEGAKLGVAGRGRELIILDSSHDWVHVEAILIPPSHEEGATEEEEEGKTVTGWVSSKGFVSAATQDGDRIIFGEAVDSEEQASSRRG